MLYEPFEEAQLRDVEDGIMDLLPRGLLKVVVQSFAVEQKVVLDFLGDKFLRNELGIRNRSHVLADLAYKAYPRSIKSRTIGVRNERYFSGSTRHEFQTPRYDDLVPATLSEG